MLDTKKKLKNCLKEEKKYYIDESKLDNLVFLDNGTQFVITSEKSG